MKKKLTRFKGGYIPKFPLARVVKTPLVNTFKKKLPALAPYVQSKFASYIKQGASQAAPLLFNAAGDFMKKKGRFAANKKSKQRERPSVFSDGQGIDKSIFVVGKKKKTLPSATCNLYRFRANNADRFSAGLNSQGVNDYHWLKAPNLNGYAGFMQQATTNLLTSKFIMNDFEVEFSLTNLENTPVIIDLYHYHDRYDSSNTSQSGFRSWQAGMTNATGAGSLTLSNLQVTPYDSPEFVALYKVDSKRTITLSSGATHIHKLVVHVNKTVNRARLNASANAMAGFSRGTMFVYKGTPVHDINLPNKVQSGKCALDVTYESFARFSNVYSSFVQNLYVDNTSAVTTPSTTVEATGGNAVQL